MTRSLFEALVLGLVCAGIERGLEAGIVAFVVTTGLAAHWLGRRNPDAVARTAWILWATPTAVGFADMALRGEFTQPEHSTGGMVSMLLWVSMTIGWWPVLWLLGKAGADRAATVQAGERVEDS